MTASRVLVFAIAVLGGCSFREGARTTATSDAADPPPSGDAIIPPIDGYDARSIARTLQQTTDDTIAPPTTTTCENSSDGHTLATTWYRAFALSDYAIPSTMHVTAVAVAVDRQSSSATLTISVGTYAGAVGASTIDLALVTEASSVQVASAAPGAVQLVPIPTAVIPAGGNFVVSVAAPDMPGGYFYMATTTSAEIHPGYLTSPGCNINQPETVAASGAVGDVIIYVKGETP